MPLEKGSSKETIGHNIEEMEKSGHPHKQAVAAALHNAYDVEVTDAPNFNESKMSGAEHAGQVKSHDCDAGAPTMPVPTGPDFGAVLPIQDATLNWNNGQEVMRPGGYGDTGRRSASTSAVSGVDAIVGWRGDE